MLKDIGFRILLTELHCLSIKYLLNVVQIYLALIFFHLFYRSYDKLYPAELLITKMSWNYLTEKQNFILWALFLNVLKTAKWLKNLIYQTGNWHINIYISVTSLEKTYRNKYLIIVCFCMFSMLSKWPTSSRIHLI